MIPGRSPTVQGTFRRKEGIPLTTVGTVCNINDDVTERTALSGTSRRSLLQLEILARLDRGVVKTVTELADSVNSQRPAVSRSLKTLRQQGLVQRGKEGWKLTDAGGAEAKEAATRVADILEAARKVAESTIWDWPGLAHEQGFMRKMLSIQQALSSRLAASFDVGQVFQSLAPPPLPRELFMVSSTMEQVMKPISEAIQPFLDAQAQHNTLVGEIMRSQAAFSGIGELITRNNASIARALENIQAVGLATQVRATSLDQVLYVGVTDHLRELGQAYKGLLHSQIARLADIRPAVPPDLAWRDITVPSVTVGSYTRSLRWEVHREGDHLPALEQLDFEEGAGSQLDDLLESLDPRFVDMRHGSWQALHSNNPDRARHAAVSFRELLRQLLVLLVPEAMASRDVPGSKMKSAVQRLLGGSQSSAEFAVAVADAIYSWYSYLNKPVHTDYKHLQAVRAALVAGEGLLLFLLVHRDERLTR